MSHHSGVEVCVCQEGSTRGQWMVLCLVGQVSAANVALQKSQELQASKMEEATTALMQSMMKP